VGCYVAAAETHSGAVLFVGDLAFKLKKPVDLGFLDWRTRAARRLACERELELNRRFAPDVYLGVAELPAPPGREPEPVLVMRRLPDDRRLSTLVRAGADVEAPLRHLAHQLAAFHLAAAPTAVAAEVAGLDATLGRWELNHERLAPLVHDVGAGALAEATVAAARRYLTGRRLLLEARVRDGWARDGHGDLLADDVFCLDDGPRVLDCLDFDERLRAGDVLADVAFLAMDLDRLGRPDLGWRLLLDHRELTGDRWPDSLAHHHVAYRAQVRALVTFLRADQGEPGAGPAGTDLLERCRRHLEAAAVRLVLVGGGPGTGKSTLAAGLARRTGAVVLRSDEVRKELAGLAPGDRAGAGAFEGIYTPAWTARTYDALLARARRLLELGESVVLDASWREASWRDAARAAAAAAVADVVELRCDAPVAVAAGRAARRAEAGRDASDADAGVARFLAGGDPWPEARAVGTGGDPAVALDEAVRSLGAV